MSAHSKLTALFALLFMILSFAGCSDKSSPTNNNPNPNLTDDFGGYKATNESPAFGDAEIMGLDGGMEANDGMMGSHLIDSLDNSTSRNIYAVQLSWGHLQYDSLAAGSTDWSGSFTVDRGAIVAIRLMGFEDGDRIVQPRTSPTTIEFVSHTRGFHDGILLYVYDPIASEPPLPNHFIVTTTPYSQTFTVSDLDSLNEVIDVGDNQVSVSAFRITRLECGEGYIDGRWIRNGNDGNQGVFLGRWIAKDGVLFGHVRGHFGIRDNGDQVLFGKWIGASSAGETPGVFKGLLRGNWGVDENAAINSGSTGWFRGDIYDRDLTKVGQFNGNWASVAPDSGDGSEGNGHGSNIRGKGHGFLRGEWQQECE